MYVLEKFWEQILWIPNPTFWPPWWGSFALEKASSAPYSHGLPSDYWTRLATVFHLQKLFQVFMLLFPLPSFHVKFGGQKEPISCAHLYALKPSNALTASNDNLCISLLCHRFFLRRKSKKFSVWNKPIMCGVAILKRKGGKNQPHPCLSLHQKQCWQSTLLNRWGHCSVHLAVQCLWRQQLASKWEGGNLLSEGVQIIN